METTESNQTTGYISSESIRKRRLFRVGIFSIGGLLILAIGIFVMGDRRNLFSKTFTVTAYFENVEGLLSGAAVVVNGIRVGSVTDVKLVVYDTASRVKVDMVIEEEYRKMIHTGSIAAISQLGIVGDKQVEILTTDFSMPVVRNGDVIQAAPPANYLAILEKADRAVQNVNNITASLDTLFLRFRRGEGTLGKLLTDDEAYNELVGVGESAQALFDETTRQFTDLSSVLRSTADNVDGITHESQKLIRDLGQGKGTVGALLYDRSLYDSLETLVGTLSRTADNAGMAAREFGTNMRGLRNNWLVGGLFSGGESDEMNVELMQRELDIKKEEHRQQEALLKQREQELLER